MAAATLLLPVLVDETSREEAKFSFEHVGDKYFLRTIETPVGVYTIATPRIMAELVQRKNDGAVLPQVLTEVGTMLFKTLLVVTGSPAQKVLIHG